MVICIFCHYIFSPHPHSCDKRGSQAFVSFCLQGSFFGNRNVDCMKATPCPFFCFQSLEFLERASQRGVWSGQLFGNGLVQWFLFSGSFMMSQSRCQMGLYSSEGLSGAGGADSKMVLSHRWQVCDCCSRTLSVGLPTCAYSMVTDFLQSKETLTPFTL